MFLRLEAKFDEGIPIGLTPHRRKQVVSVRTLLVTMVGNPVMRGVTSGATSCHTFYKTRKAIPSGTALLQE